MPVACHLESGGFVHRLRVAALAQLIIQAYKRVLVAGFGAGYSAAVGKVKVL